MFDIHLVLSCRIQDTIEDGGNVIVALEGVEDVGSEGGDQGVPHTTALQPLLSIPLDLDLSLTMLPCASVLHVSSLLSVMCLNDLKTKF